MSESKLSPIHPGEILFEEFLNPLDISQYRLAKDIHVPPRRNEDFLTLQEVVTDYEDLKTLREAKVKEKHLPTIPLNEAKKLLDVT